MVRNWILLAAAASLTAPLFAQVQTRRATITGNGGDQGKCTIEVRVDIAAEVEVSGDMGRIRTLSGQPSNWVRFECSSPLPRNPVDFRFRGIDGRGNVQLIRDPQSTRGTAVVRIEDSKGRSEGYTFDLEWRGGSTYDSSNRGGWNGYDNGRQNNDRYDGNDQYNRNNRDYNRDDRFGNNTGAYNRGNRDSVVTCAANGNRRTYCDADTSGGVRLLREHGNSSCQLGSTWGFDRRGIWVDRGCRGDFQIGR
jgi:Protein of unknown function (DUF3011)